MIVVSDNGPIAFLVLIGHEELLPRIYGEVLAPPAVLRELRHPHTPEAVRSWIAAHPSWLCEKAPTLSVESQGSGAGEREAIQLAKELNATLLCDDRAAVNQARRVGLIVTGTLGVLQLAHERRWVEIEVEVERLRLLTTMHLPEDRILQIISDAHTMRSRRDARDAEST